jgi:hypothetical protein
MFYKRSSVKKFSGQELFSYKGLKNDLAYFAKASIAKERSFPTLATGDESKDEENAEKYHKLLISRIHVSNLKYWANSIKFLHA